MRAEFPFSGGSARGRRDMVCKISGSCADGPDTQIFGAVRGCRKNYIAPVPASASKTPRYVVSVLRPLTALQVAAAALPLLAQEHPSCAFGTFVPPITPTCVPQRAQVASLR